jgi:hypothetical protein
MNEMTGLDFTIKLLLVPLFLHNAISFYAYRTLNIQSHQRSAEAERDRAYLRQQFQKNFKNLQLLGQGLLKVHEDAKLTPERLEKDAKSINKCAKTLRSLMGLGEMAKSVEVDNELTSPQKFDDSIRKLSTLISAFAHNPVHQNSKVFNTDQAERAQTDLLAIINLSKALINKSKGYALMVTQ